MSQAEILAVHIRGNQPPLVWRHAGGLRQLLPAATPSPASEIMRLAEGFPESYIAWIDERLEPFVIDIEQWPDLIEQPLEVLHLSSIQVCHQMVESLGFVDFESPFLLPAPTDRRYPTWLISSGAGIGLASALRAAGLEPRFRSFAATLFDFGHRGLGSGLCPYSEPRLLRQPVPEDILHDLSVPLTDYDVALLIRLCYGRKWTLFWTFACGFFRQSWPWKAALSTLFHKSAVLGDAQLMESLHPQRSVDVGLRPSIDVIIPTMGRLEHLKNVLEDLAKQSVLPRKVFIVEQDPEGAVSTARGDLDLNAFPFETDYQIVRWIGACRARNLGLEKSMSDWTLLLDDDVRFSDGLLLYLLQVATTYRVKAVNGATYLPGQRLDLSGNAQLPKPWSTCNGAILLIERSLRRAAGFFDERLEGGYGEDFEFGIRVRLNGSHILYAPGEPILHLKAPSGGFRRPYRHAWSDENPQPRPSPVFLYSRTKHSPDAMQKGYQLFYWLKRLASTPVYRWAWELRAIQRQWRSAVTWAGRLASQNQV